MGRCEKYACSRTKLRLLYNEVCVCVCVVSNAKGSKDCETKAGEGGEEGSL